MYKEIITVCSEIHAVHDHVYYHVCPDVLSLVCDPLWDTGVVHRITHLVISFLFICYFIPWYKEKWCCIKSQADHVLFT
jgi:hypothetical protein